MYEFLWDHKPDKIKRITAMKKIERGGISMPDLNIFDKSLKLTWLRRFVLNESKWKHVISVLFPNINDFWKYGDDFALRLSKNITNPFWSNVFKYYYELYRTVEITTLEEVYETSFLFNKNILIGKQVISNKELRLNNLYLIKEFMVGREFISHEEFNLKNNTNINYLSFLSIVKSIKEFINHIDLEENGKKINYQPALNIIMKNKSGASFIYSTFSNNNKNICKGFEKWNRLLNIEKDEWLGFFSLLKFTTRDTKLRWFQFRILHNILTTNRSVAKYCNEQSHLCTFCNKESETIQHLFWSCEMVNKFWKDLASMINKRCVNVYNFSFSEKLVLFGQSEFIYTDEVCNLIILIAKYFIYRSKVQNISPNLKNFINTLFKRYEAEKLITHNSQDFKNRWNQYLNLFKSLL